MLSASESLEYGLPALLSALETLVALGHVERLENIDPGYPFRHFGYRLTAQGRKYYHEAVVPRLPPRLQSVAPTN